MLIDIHSHLFEKRFDEDRDAVFARMKAADVATITVGTDYMESVESVALAEKYDMWATVGLHPTDNTREVFDFDKYKALAQNPKVVAIGECGLDYFQMKHSPLPAEEEKERQKQLFLQHVELAKEIDKPLMIHCRDAYEDILPMIIGARGNVHFFSGTWDVARQFLDLGFTLSFPGTITFSHQYDVVVKNVPEDMFMVETDSPYVSPIPHRGKRNEPAYVLETVKKIAQLRGISVEEVAQLTTATAKRVFALKP